MQLQGANESGRAGMPAPEMVLFVLTEARTGLAHLVTEDSMILGRHLGRYVTCCGREVLASSLAAPESGPCRPCRRWRAGW